MNEFKKFREGLKPNLTTVAMFEIMSSMLDLDDPDSDINDEDSQLKSIDSYGFFSQVKEEMCQNPEDVINSIVNFDLENIDDDLISKVRP